MKIVDCFMYLDEDLMLDIRLNTLNKYVSNFIICESTFNHNGNVKKLNFDIKKFTKFKDKITYIVLDKKPFNLHKINNDDLLQNKNSKILDNALYRENYQRNFLASQLYKYSEEDLILINDLDEIPNLENFKYKHKITIFKQKLFYYKLNLLYPNYLWIGSKICKKKHLINPQWLRNIKSKKYPIWRLDIIFSKKKYSNLGFVEDGGWHFTNVKSLEQIDYKMKNYLHHLEYEESGLKTEDLKKIITEKKALYDLNKDSKDKKWSSQIKLETVPNHHLPNYVFSNLDKYKNWLD